MSKSNLKFAPTFSLIILSLYAFTIYHLPIIVAVTVTATTQNVLPEPHSHHECPTLPSLNYRPVIGILTHPRISGNGSYLAASYVKFVEAAGARVIPLFYDEPWSLLSSKMELVNGVLLTGGSCKTGVYLDVVSKILEKVKERNNGGDYFPLYAICLGFELLSMIVSKNDQILEHIDAMNMRSPLLFIDGVNLHGSIFGSFPPHLRKSLKDDCLVFHHHMFGISKERFDSSEPLTRFFEVLTTCEDENKKEYVTTVQARKYPITGFQWHPEKNAFEWGLSEIPHSLEAIEVTQHAANFLVSEARKSHKQAAEEEVLSNLIYKYNTKYTGDDGKGFDETCLFEASPSMASNASSTIANNSHIE